MRSDDNKRWHEAVAVEMKALCESGNLGVVRFARAEGPTIEAENVGGQFDRAV